MDVQPARAVVIDEVGYTALAHAVVSSETRRAESFSQFREQMRRLAKEIDPTTDRPFIVVKAAVPILVERKEP
jgi:hypothetical protein